MMTEVARVVAVEPGYLCLETIQKSTCNSCAAQKGCGYGLMNKASHQRRAHFKLAIEPDFNGSYQVNDRVQIAFPESLLVRAALLVYILPLLIMLLLAAVASAISSSELVVVLAAVTGLLLGFLLLAWSSQHKTRLFTSQICVLSDKQPPASCVEVIQ